MLINKIDMHELEMDLKTPFLTNYGLTRKKKIILIELHDELGNIGWGEGCAFEIPWYTEETHQSSMYVIENFLVPLILGKKIIHPNQVNDLFSSIKRNNMAKAAIETAVWDCFAKRNNMTVADALGGTSSTVQVGISIGIQKDVNTLLTVIQNALDEGYFRIKLKLEKGKEYETLEKVRKKFPFIPLMLDMNSAYTLKDIKLLQSLDEFDLMMLEQPLGDNDFVDHAILRKYIETPVCLDESIHTLEDATVAIELESCDIINIKLSRVGGLAVAKQIHDLCEEHDIPVWSGGMLETGVGRAHNIALSSLDNFIIPGDISSSSRYWEEDITKIPITMEEGLMKIPNQLGIGYEIDKEKVRKYRISKKSFIS